MSKISANRDDLLKALQLVSKAISTRAVLPLLSNVLLEVKNNKAKLSGTDYSFGIKTEIAIEGNQSEFYVAVPVKLFTDLVNNLQAERVELKFDAKTVQLSILTDVSKNNLKGIDDLESFPDIPSVKDPIAIPAGEFKEAVSRVAFAASASQLQSVLHGVLVAIEKGKLILVAVDGFRLSYEEIKLNDLDKKKELRAIIPSNNLEEISRIIDDEGFFEMSITDNQARFKSGKNNIFVQLIDGNFPDHNTVKPKKAETVITAKTIDFLYACNQVALFTSNGYTKLDVNSNSVVMSAVETEVGDSKIVLSIDMNGSDIAVGINATLFKQFLQACYTEQFTIDFVDSNLPMLFRMKDFSTYYHIIMPMGLKE